MKWHAVAWATLLGAALAAPPSAQADARYTVTVVGSADSVAYDVNNLGQVVGYMATPDGNYHGFLYDGGTLSDLGTLGGASSYAYRLNDSGTVVGAAYLGDQLYGFMYAGGAMTALPTGPGSQANDINNAGVIAGTYASTDSAGDFQPHAFTYAGGAVIDLGTLPSGYGTYGNAINDLGHVAGTAEVDGPPNRPTDPFFYSDGAMQNIGNFGGIFSNAWAMNNHDQVVGSAGGEYTDGALYPFRAFLYDHGVLHDLGTMREGGNSSAYGINELGQIVGFTDTAAGSKTYLYEDGAMVLLDTLIDPASGWTITDANGINDRQQIAGRACRGDLCYAVRLDLASSVPEPGQLAMLLAGLLAFGFVRRLPRRRARQPGSLCARWRTLPLALVHWLPPPACCWRLPRPRPRPPTR